MSKKGENIYKRKDNRWEGRYIKSRCPDGAPQYGYCYGKTYQEVRQKLLQAKADLLMGKTAFSKSNKHQLAYYCEQWLQINRSKIKESTYVKYAATIENHIKPQLGNCRMQNLSSQVIEAFSHSLLTEKGLSPKTVKDILITLHTIIKYAGKQMPQAMPMIEIIYPKVPKTEMRVLTKQEQHIFVQSLLRDMDSCKFGVLLALFTGMRLGEVCALRWGDISVREGTIQVRATMQRLQDLGTDTETKTKIIITEPKSQTSNRVIPLTEYAARLCASRQCNSPQAFVLTGNADVFIEPRTMQNRLRQYTRDCGLEGVHFHTLRHTFATRCVEVDFEIKSLSEILGHSSPQITLERYVHASLALKRDNMRKLSAIGF